MKLSLDFNKSIKNYGLALLMVCCISSCKKFVDVEPPPGSLIAENVFDKDVTAIAAMTDVYPQILNSGNSYSGFFGSFSGIPALLSDEMTLQVQTGDEITEIYLTSYTSRNTLIENHWLSTYNIIYRVNNILKNLETSKNVTVKIKDQLDGEALFIRSLCFFQLVNTYGGVPLAITNDYSLLNKLPRASEGAVWLQITTDLNQAASLLSKEYRDPLLISSTSDRVRPNYWVAKALLARVALYQRRWQDAIESSSELIVNKNLFDLEPIERVFLKDSKEAIWQLQQVNSPESNSQEGADFILPSSGPDFGKHSSLSEHLFQIFEDDDARKSQWINSVSANGMSFHYPFKYKLDATPAPSTEYSTWFRLAEQYLIRAEARAQLGDIDGAKDDLNVIRHRAGLGNAIAATQTELLRAINLERQKELFTEGHRWFDLKRTGQINEVMSVESQLKGGIWQNFKALWPIPLREITANAGMKNNQNSGY